MTYDRSILSSAVVLSLFMAASLNAQSWAKMDAGGYGAAGAFLGGIATVNADCDSGDDFICVPWEFVAASVGGMAAGAIVGHQIGRRADDAVERGEPLGPARLAAVAMGPMLTLAAVGSLGAWYLEDEFDVADDSFLSSPKAMGILGAGAGLVLVILRRDELLGHQPSVTPTVLPDGRVGLTATVRF
jgi:hypothetical protein